MKHLEVPQTNFMSSFSSPSLAMLFYACLRELKQQLNKKELKLKLKLTVIDISKKTKISGNSAKKLLCKIHKYTKSHSSNKVIE